MTLSFRTQLLASDSRAPPSYESGSNVRLRVHSVKPCLMAVHERSVDDWEAMATVR